jgi:hypothetical protein
VTKPNNTQKEIPLNPLCLSCRRGCKQSASALIAECKRYYAGPRGSRKEWKQLPLPL